MKCQHFKFLAVKGIIKFYCPELLQGSIYVVPYIFQSKICSIQLEGCNSNSNPSQEVSNYENKYGVVGQIFDCRYNPGDQGQVIQHRAKPRPFSLALAGASGLLFIVGLVGLLVTALSCGCPCKVMCSGRPPAVIREKLGTHGGNK